MNYKTTSIALLIISAILAFFLMQKDSGTQGFEMKPTNGLITPGIVVSPATADGKLGVILMGPTDGLRELVLFKYNDTIKVKRHDEVYFETFELNGIPIADNFTQNPDPSRLQGSDFSSNLDWHSFLEHEHEESLNPVHKPRHLVIVQRLQDGRVEWTFEEEKDGTTVEVKKIGAAQYFEKFKDKSNINVWVREINGVLLEVDFCHRHEGIPVKCP